MNTTKRKMKKVSKTVKYKTIKPNIVLLPNGMYCVRKTKNGIRLSKNLTSLKACSTWLAKA